MTYQLKKTIRDRWRQFCNDFLNDDSGFDNMMALQFAFLCGALAAVKVVDEVLSDVPEDERAQIELEVKQDLNDFLISNLRARGMAVHVGKVCCN